MIRLALKNRSIEPFKWVLWGNNTPLPEGVEYNKFRCGLSGITVCCTVEDKSQQEEYERITQTPESVIEWMRQNFDISSIGSIRVAGFVVDVNGDTNQYVSFHPHHEESTSHYSSESSINLDNTNYKLCSFFNMEQFQLGIVDVLRNNCSVIGFIEKTYDAKELSITVAPGEMISVMIWPKGWKNTIGEYMSKTLNP